jgi:hypothetical protein
MGRSGIAMTFVTDQELEDLKSLLKTNRIDPVWRGHIPNLQVVPRPRREGKRTFKKRPFPGHRNQTLSHKRNVVSTSGSSPISHQ